MKKSSIILGSLLGLTVTVTGAWAAMTFKDVPADHWAAKYVDELSTAGVIQGYSDNTFKGNNQVTRYELAALTSKNNAMMMAKMTAMENKMAEMQKQLDAKPMAEKEEEGVMVGGALMVPSKDIVDNAVGSKDHTTLVAAVKAADLVETLKGKGPFTVFAPTNAAFDKLPDGTVDNLLKPENKDDLTAVLTYHVVSGKYTSKDIKEGLKLKTVQGEELEFTMKDGKWWINGTSQITIADVISSNGVTHVVNEVLMPEM